jgi:hypothetical protein
MPDGNTPKFLIHGLDTVACCYYLTATHDASIDFAKLHTQREELRLSQEREPTPLLLSGLEFLLSPNGSASGYPFVISNRDYRIEFGEHNNPSFYVTFRSEALWQLSLPILHERFLAWTRELGFRAIQTESLSRVDFTFDYHVPEIDFDEDSFVSLASKDAQHREDGFLQTFTFGRADIVLRVYDKIAEILQQSDKRWMFKLWGREDQVWRIEWQVRKEALQRFGIRTMENLHERYGDLLRYLVNEHDSLRRPTQDSNRSRWPLHPLWEDLRDQISRLDGLGVYREERRPPPYDEHLARIAVAMFGYVKRAAAILSLKTGVPIVRPSDALMSLEPLLKELYDPFAWRLDINKRKKQLELGRWST